MSKTIYLSCIQTIVYIAFLDVSGLSALMADVTYRTVMLSGQPAPGSGSSRFRNVATSYYQQELVLNDSGHVAFRAEIAGADEFSDEGIWAEAPGGLRLVVRENSPAPGAMQAARFGDKYGYFGYSLTFNNAGHVAFISKLRGESIDESNDEGIWSDRAGQLEPIVLEGMPAPGTAPGVVFGHRGPVDTPFGPIVPHTFYVDASRKTAFNNAGQVAFVATLSGDGIDDFNNEGIWSERYGSLGLVARTGMIAPGLNSDLRFDRFMPTLYALNDNGQVAFTQRARKLDLEPSLEDSPVYGIWSEGSGNLELVATSGMHAPGTPDGVEFNDFWFDSAAINNSGVAFFPAFLRGDGVQFGNDSGLWTNRSGELELVARASSPTPDASTTFASVGYFLGQNDHGRIAFRAILPGDIETLWSDVSGVLSMIAADGQSAPGTSEVFTFLGFPLAVNNAGQVAFLAEANDVRGVWVTDSSGRLRPIILTGDVLEIAPGDARTVQALAYSNQFNDAGQLAFWAQLSGGLEGVFVASQRTAIPEPESTALLSVACALCAFGRSSSRMIPRRFCFFGIWLVALLLTVPIARADIYQWEYINLADPSQGKRQSTMLAPGGAGVSAVPGAFLDDRNLTMAYLIAADLTDADFYRATLNGADFSSAEVRSASFRDTTSRGFTMTQLYSTASYDAGDLSGIDFGDNDLAGWNFTGQNLNNATFSGTLIPFPGNSSSDRITTLTGANFSLANLTGAEFFRATLTGAVFNGALVQWAGFGDATSHGFTAAQLYATASYQSHDLMGIGLGANDLTGWNLSGQKLTHADFSGANLTSVNFTGAEVKGANFNALDTSRSITKVQLYSTASYQARDLTGIFLFSNNLSDWSFAEQNLTNVRFGWATLTGADFTDAVIQGADFQETTSRGFTAAQLYSTASYEAGDLTRIGLDRNDLTGWSFTAQDLTNAYFQLSTLTGADFSGAQIRRASFWGTTSRGFSAAHLYSTASYQTRNLTGIRLGGNDLTGRNFDGQDLNNAHFDSAILAGTDFYQANLTGADFRDATFAGTNFSHANLTNVAFDFAKFTNADFTGADTRGSRSLVLTSTVHNNTIEPNGHIQGLDLTGMQSLTVRDYHGDSGPVQVGPPGPIPILVEQHLTMDATGVLRLQFADAPWDSMISFEPGIPVSLGGTLQLEFAPDVVLPNQVGQTIRLFNWTGVTPTGTFTVESPYTWDLSRLYTSGEVTLLAVPEPSTTMLMIMVSAMFAFRVRLGAMCR